MDAVSRARALGAWVMRGIGPEVISGAPDNDPTNVSTAAVVGAAGWRSRSLAPWPVRCSRR